MTQGECRLTAQDILLVVEVKDKKSGISIGTWYEKLSSFVPMMENEKSSNNNKQQQQQGIITCVCEIEVPASDSIGGIDSGPLSMDFFNININSVIDF
eukprot:scaffold1727_cov133-Cylindrotheca_fusiformis.AAC.2